MKIKNALKFLLLIVVWHFTTAQMCTKKIAYAKDYSTSPLKDYFLVDKATAYQAIQKALENQGYEVQSMDQELGKINTGWRPVTSDSHFVKLFNRRDYGVSDGAYYKMNVDVSEENSNVKVLVSTTVKSIVGPLESSGVVERKVLKQVEDSLRSPQIEMTNVGVERK